MWIVTGNSESGDKYGPTKFDHEPTKKELSEWCHSRDGDPDGNGPGDYGSYIYVEVNKL